MIDRMFIQEEKTTLALDKQLAKEKPGERGGMGRVSPPPPSIMHLDAGIPSKQPDVHGVHGEDRGRRISGFVYSLV